MTSQRRVRIKVCGTTQQEDALAAIEAGVDALGFIFARKSPRYVTIDQASRIIEQLPPFIGRVGVFVDSSVSEIMEHVSQCGLTQIQLHGAEPPDFCRELKLRSKGVDICKAFRIGQSIAAADIASYHSVVSSILFDTYRKGAEGGTGKSFDWELIDGLRINRPLILAGGLRPDNIQPAIVKVRPYAVDVNSGIEKKPGIKDHHLLQLFVAQVRAVEASFADSP